MNRDAKQKVVSAEEISPEAGVGDISRPPKAEVLKVIQSATYPLDTDGLVMHAQRLSASNEVLHVISMLEDRQYKNAADVEANILPQWLGKKAG
jgi:hypothetical protein